MYHHKTNIDSLDDSYEWKEDNIEPFSELLLSWNARRPTSGHYTFFVSINTGSWSPYFKYATWGNNIQRSFESISKTFPVQVFQDTIDVTEGKLGIGFKVKVVAINKADLLNLTNLHMCASRPEHITIKKHPYLTPSTLLNVDGLSQKDLNDPRGHRLCSPTSTTSIVRYLQKTKELHPISFAENCLDSGFDIFGNWVFNAAEANHHLHQSKYSCWVERYQNFSNILHSLKKGIPTAISIKGPLVGSASPYNDGHLITIIGFNKENQEVICMDPAFPKHDKTIVKYKLNYLLDAWHRRKNLSYVFSELT